jgi:nucleotide-binding universal stress UspA family protein
MHRTSSVNWKTLLVPQDFSFCAERAEALAMDLAKTLEARVLLLHVCEIPANLRGGTLIHQEGSLEPIAVDRYVEESAAKKLDERAARLRLRGVDIATAVAIGSVAETILEHAAASGADAIVMGTHGRRGLKHLLMGSVAERVVRLASVPVVTVRSDETIAATEPVLTEPRGAALAV